MTSIITTANTSATTRHKINKFVMLFNIPLFSLLASFAAPTDSCCGLIG